MKQLFQYTWWINGFTSPYYPNFNPIVNPLWINTSHSQMLHVWNIDLHLPRKWAKCMCTIPYMEHLGLLIHCYCNPFFIFPFFSFPGSRFHAPLRPSCRLQSVGPRHLRGLACARRRARAAAVDRAAHCAAALFGGEGHAGKLSTVGV